MNRKTPSTTLIMRTFLQQAAVVSLLGLGAVSAWALPSDRNQQITLLADRATFSEKTGVTTYTGNVVIEQGTMKLQANSIVANLNSRKEISTITANGSPARFQQKLEANKGLAKGQAQKLSIMLKLALSHCRAVPCSNKMEPVFVVQPYVTV